MKVSQKTRYLLTWLLAVTFSLSAYAQDITVTGTVFDETGEPLIGATVMQKGSGNGVSTDIDGNYLIKVPSKSFLTFSYIGYETKTVEVKGQTKIDVTMDSSSNMLEEVVAIGYGTVKKKDLTGAVSSVSGKDIAKVPVANVATALQGKAAGLNIVSQSSAPGASLNVTVRGGTSITQSTKPLYIVDGFTMDDALTNLDANDIETIDVLKDASATAIYGARGSNGIIVITTKSAAKGKTKVDYNAFFSWEKLSQKIDMLDNTADYVRYQYEMAELQGKTSMWANIFDEGSTPGAGFYEDVVGADGILTSPGVYTRIANRYNGAYNVDWQDEVFGGTAFTQNHNVSVSTGNDKLQAMVTYNHNGQDGLLANHDYQRNSLRAKMNAQLYPHIKFDFSAFFYNNVVHGGGNYSGMKDVLLQPINGGTYFTREQLVNTQTYPSYNGIDSTFDTANPLIQNEASTSEKRSRHFDVNGGVTIDFLKHFTWRTAGNYSTNWSKSTSFANERSTSYIMDPKNTGMNGTIGNSESYGWHITNTLTWQQEFGKHDITVLLGQEYSYSESEGNSMKMRKFPYPNHGLDDIKNVEVYEQSTSHSRSNMLSFFGRASYNYDNRYLVSATMRADGSSKFARGNKWGYFPSASAAWRISQEKFWLDNNISNVINNLKLRVGYGVTGNNGIGANLYTTQLTMTSYPMGNDENMPAFVFGETRGNKDLKWETLHATNIGLDLGLFSNRVDLSVEWYNNQISDMLFNAVIPSSTGFKKQLQNIGEMRNRGWEISLNTVNIDAGGFQWTSSLNLSFNRSKVISLANGESFHRFNVGKTREGQVTYYATVGESLGDMIGYKYLGTYSPDEFDEVNGKFVPKENVLFEDGKTPQPGDIKWDLEKNADGKLVRKLQKIGNGTPDCIGGFNNTFTYKGFDLSIFLKFSIGNDIYNATKQSMTPYAMFQNIPTEFNSYYRLVDPLTGRLATSLDRVRELNAGNADNTWSLSSMNRGYISDASSYFVEDGSYLRIGQITLGYTFPSKWLKKAYISNLRLYFTCNNVATWTNYSGYNPDTSSANDNVICTPGYDSSAYPLSRSYVLGINLSF